MYILIYTVKKLSNNAREVILEIIRMSSCTWDARSIAVSTVIEFNSIAQQEQPMRYVKDLKTYTANEYIHAYSIP